MPRFSVSQNSFNGGEMAPEVQGRRDIPQYAIGAETIENFIVTPEGGLHRRHGTRFAGFNADTSERSRLVTFTYADGSSYVLEFADLAIFVWKGTDQILAASRTLDNTAVDTNTAFDEITLEDHGYVDGNTVSITGSGLPTGVVDSSAYDIELPETLTGDLGNLDTGAETLTVDTPAAPNWQDGMGPYRFTTDGDSPAVLDAFTDYYLRSTTATTTQLSLTAGGAAINLTGAGGGAGVTWTLRPTQDYMRDKFRLLDGGSTLNITAAGTGTSTIQPFTDTPQEIRTDYALADLADLQFAQSEDTLYIAHPDYHPAQLSRISDTQWAWDYMALVDGPYLDENEDKTKTITVSSHTLGARCTLTLSDASIINDGEGFRQADLGRLVRFADTGGSTDTPGYVEIDDIDTTTQAKGTILQAAGGTAGAHWRWRMGAWYPGNYPAAVAVAEQRLCFAGESEATNFVTASNTGAFNVFRPNDPDSDASSPTVRATDSVRVGLYDKRVHRIKWLAVGRTLMAGTDSAVFAVRGSLDGEAFSPTNINAVKISSVGASSVPPVAVSRHNVYVTRNSQGVRAFEGDSGGSQSEAPMIDLSLLARHVFARTESIEEMAYQFDRRSIVWFVRSDGVLLGCTFVPEQGVFAWHTHTLGGVFGSGSAVVESVAVDSATGGAFDRVWLIVKRTVGGSTTRHVEYFEDEWLDGSATSQYFVDCHPAPFSGAATDTFTGYDHLIDETLVPLADGATHPDELVEEPIAGNGQIVTPAEHTAFVAGYGYTSTFRSLPYDLPDPEGSSHGKMARADHAVLRLWQSHTGEIGVVDWDGTVPLWNDIIQRGAGDVFGTPKAAFTGDEKKTLDGGFERRHQLEIRQTQPLSFNLLSLTLQGNSGPR